jgi:hypothetical protein
MHMMFDALWCAFFAAAFWVLIPIALWIYALVCTNFFPYTPYLSLQ